VLCRQSDTLFVVVADLYYVRVIGTVDNSRPAKVAVPWTPSNGNIDGVDLCLPFSCSSLDNSLHGTPRDSPVTVKAYAGPMSSSQVCKPSAIILYSACGLTPPLPLNRPHRSNDDCLLGKREDYQVCSVQYYVHQLCTVQCTNISTDLTVVCWSDLAFFVIALCVTVYQC